MQRSAAPAGSGAEDAVPDELLRMQWSLRAVTHPASIPPFEVLAHLRPSLRLDGSLDYATAWWMSVLCQASYFRPEALPAELAAAQIEMVGQWQSGTQSAYAVRFGEARVLVFRGSVSLEDWKLNFSFLPQGCADGRQYHRGFVQAYESLAAPLQAFAASLGGSPLHVTGHSLGGALAQLAAGHLGARSLWTFGAPRVNHLERPAISCPFYRFENGVDIVPRLPMHWLGFRHGGELIHLGADGCPRREPSLKRQAWESTRACLYWLAFCDWAGEDAAPLRSIADHAPVNYARSLLRAHLAERAP